MIYFGIAGAAFANGVVLLYTKFVKKTKRATRDRGAYLMFAILMFVIAAGAFALGMASL